MEKLLEIIKEVSKYNIEIEVNYSENSDSIEYLIGGFYKSGIVSLYCLDEQIFVRGRYNEIDVIYDIEDLVQLNYRWWINSRERYNGWIAPSQEWIPLLEKYNLIQKETNIVVTYK